MTVRATLLLAALALCFAAACGGSGDGDDAAQVDPPNPVRGMLTEVDATGAGELDSITLRDDDGAEWPFTVLLDNPTSVTAAHLEEHIRLSQPVLVYFRGSDTNRQAYQIDDAP